MNGLKKVQDEWHDSLTKFVTDYPAAKDTPDALNYLAIGSEFAGKDEEAKRWYRLIYTNFPTHPLAEKAKGCVRRLESIGQPMELVSPTLDGRANFNVASLKGKVVAVYYWASFCQSCPREFAVLKQLHDSLQSKGLELVCVNLDDTPAEAVGFLTKQSAARHPPVPGGQVRRRSQQSAGRSLRHQRPADLVPHRPRRQGCQPHAASLRSGRRGQEAAVTPEHAAQASYFLLRCVLLITQP